MKLLKRFSAGLLVGVLAIAFGYFCASLGAVEPKPTPKPDIMDSPIPPGAQEPGKRPVVPIPSGLGYCVTWNDDIGTLAKIDVPFHRPNPDHMDEFRGSVRNALALAANQLDVKAAVEPDLTKRGRYQREAAKLKHKLAIGITFGGTEGTLSPDGKPMRNDGDGGVNCVCSSICGDACGGAYFCGGACGGCEFCS